MLDYDCSYLPGKKTRMYYRYMRHADKTLVSELIRRGWRRFDWQQVFSPPPPPERTASLPAGAVASCGGPDSENIPRRYPYR
jgi:arginyl-tRNA--protein-N-Asp/Glu arginylyltransferase